MVYFTCYFWRRSLYFRTIYFKTKAVKIRQPEVERKVEVRTKQLKAEKITVEKKNNQILQSINYAKRIQGSILPDQSLLNEFLVIILFFTSLKMLLEEILLV